MIIGKDVDEIVQIRLIDSSGRLVEKIDAIEQNEIHFGKNVLPGIYLAEIMQGNDRKVVKLIRI